MAHKIEIHQIEGTYNSLLASSSGKKLILSTSILNGETITTYDVQHDSKTYPFTELQSAIDYYNKS